MKFYQMYHLYCDASYLKNKSEITLCCALWLYLHRASHRSAQQSLRDWRFLAAIFFLLRCQYEKRQTVQRYWWLLHCASDTVDHDEKTRFSKTDCIVASSIIIRRQKLANPRARRKRILLFCWAKCVYLKPLFH